MIVYFTAEATRLERALTKPLETDDLDDLSLEPDDITPPKKKQPAKQPAKRKSPTPVPIASTAVANDKSTTTSNANMSMEELDCK